MELSVAILCLQKVKNFNRGWNLIIRRHCNIENTPFWVCYYTLSLHTHARVHTHIHIQQARKPLSPGSKKIHPDEITQKKKQNVDQPSFWDLSCAIRGCEAEHIAICTSAGFEHRTIKSYHIRMETIHKDVPLALRVTWACSSGLCAETFISCKMWLPFHTPWTERQDLSTFRRAIAVCKRGRQQWFLYLSPRAQWAENGPLLGLFGPGKRELFANDQLPGWVTLRFGLQMSSKRVGLNQWPATAPRFRNAHGAYNFFDVASGLQRSVEWMWGDRRRAHPWQSFVCALWDGMNARTN